MTPSNRLTPAEVVPDADAPVPAPLGARLVTKLSHAPVPVEGTWVAARRWRDMAAHAEEVKLFCQVMLGFELLHLREAHGETRGGPVGRVPSKTPFHDLAWSETGLGHSSVCKLMSMAEAAVGQLKKLPGLKGFDPTHQPIGQLPAPQQEALSAAVRKLTDGLTQTDFLVELGIWKAPQGSGAKGGARERPPKSRLGLDEKAEEARRHYRERWAEFRLWMLSSELTFTLTEDEEIRGEINFLEARCKAMRAFVGQHPQHRDLAKVKALLPSR